MVVAIRLMLRVLCLLHLLRVGLSLFRIAAEGILFWAGVTSLRSKLVLLLRFGSGSFIGGFSPLTCHRILNSSGDLGSTWRDTRWTLMGRTNELFDLLFVAGCWEVWNERIRRIFDNSVASSAICAARISNTFNLWCLAYLG